VGVPACLNHALFMKNPDIEPTSKPGTRLRPGRPTPAAATERDSALLDTCRELFIHHGFQHVSISTIAEVAGVATRTIYSRFGGKRGLLVSVIEREQEGRLARLTGIAEGMLEDVLCPQLRQLQCDVVAERDPALVLRLQPGFYRRWQLALARVFERDEWKAACSLACGPSIVADLFIGCVLAKHIHELPGEPFLVEKSPALGPLARARVDRFLLAATRSASSA
jgi:AcrR family transcriptional regulator